MTPRRLATSRRAVSPAEVEVRELWADAQGRLSLYSGVEFVGARPSFADVGGSRLVDIAAFVADPGAAVEGWADFPAAEREAALAWAAARLG